MRVLVVTRIFPNRVEPTFGPYNSKQFSALKALGHDVQVVCPVPWFPGASLLRGKTRAANTDAVPAEDVIGGLPVLHPRFLHVPRLLSAHAPIYAASLLPHLLPIKQRFDVILSPFAYPDGVASVLLGQALGLPVVVKLHGGDMNVGARLPGPGRWIRWAFPRAAGIVAVSQPLADLAREFGAKTDRIRVVQDGVDDQVFFVRDAAQIRKKLDYPAERRPLVFVGRLERRKGVFELIEAFGKIADQHPDVDLVLVGDGEDTARCRDLTRALGTRVRLTGNLLMDGVRDWLSAAAVVTLPSHAEGTPNVVIEALASGRPVVATDVGGIPQMIFDERMGSLVPKEDVAALAAALSASLTRTYDPDLVVRLSGRGTWKDSAAEIAQSLEQARALSP